MAPYLREMNVIDQEGRTEKKRRKRRRRRRSKDSDEPARNEVWMQESVKKGNNIPSIRSCSTARMRRSWNACPTKARLRFLRKEVRQLILYQQGIDGTGRVGHSAGKAAKQASKGRKLVSLDLYKR